MTWWAELTTLEQVFWVLAVLSTLFFAASSLLSFADFGHHGTDPSLEQGGHEALEFFDLRTSLAFALGFGWSGALFAPSLGVGALLLALPAGLGFALANRRLTRQLRRLESSGNLRLTDAIGEEARVSVEIDPSQRGLGKVVVRVRERELELLAATEDSAPLKRGERVQVYGVEGGRLLVSREDKLGLRDL